MGYALIVTTVSEENLADTAIWARDGDGKEIRLSQHYGRKWYRERRHLRTRHPDAYYRVEVPVADVWELPVEPPVPPEVLDATHGVTVRRSLQTFINERLERLSAMVRSGRWVLGNARVRVTKCEPVDWSGDRPRL